ncbi:MAG: hypothetical protein ACFFDN_14755 [Candidatus Hodarchaeota archaeon]
MSNNVDINFFIIMIAAITIFLFIMIELSSPYYGENNFSLNRKILRTAAIILTILYFFVTIFMMI